MLSSVRCLVDVDHLGVTHPSSESDTRESEDTYHERGMIAFSQLLQPTAQSRFADKLLEV